MEGGVTLIPSGSIDCRNLKAPRERSWPSEKFMVEPISPASDSLSNENSWSKRINRLKKGDAPLFALKVSESYERSERNGTPNSHSTFPDFEGISEVSLNPEIQFRSGYHMVEPTTDYPCRNNIDRQIVKFGGNSPGFSPTHCANLKGDYYT